MNGAAQELDECIRDRAVAAHWAQVSATVGDSNAQAAYLQEIKVLDESIRVLRAVIREAGK